MNEAGFISGFTDFYKVAAEMNIKFAVATAAPPICVEFVKKSLDLEKFFKVIIDSEMVSKGKPDPECYLMAATSLGLNARDCLVFEDSPVGVAAAEKAGMHCVLLTTTHKPAEFIQFSNIIKIINNYEEISIDDCLKHF